jgi:hypothetical protein
MDLVSRKRSLAHSIWVACAVPLAFVAMFAAGGLLALLVAVL